MSVPDQATNTTSLSTTAGGKSPGYELELEKLTFWPPTAERPILDDLSLRIKGGEFVVLCGLNGAGKSTLLRVIAGDLSKSEWRGLKGRVVVANQPIRSPIHHILDGVGVVHQDDRRDLVPNLSVAQNIAVRQMLGGGHEPKFFSTPAYWRRKMLGKLHSLCPGAVANMRAEVERLSGGQRQMLSVALAVHLEHEFNPCRLLLLDEHTASLDHRNARDVMEFTAREIRASGTTTIMATHRYADAAEFASRIIILARGAVTHNLLRDERGFSADGLRQLVEGGV